MGLQKIPVTGLDDINHQRRHREITNSLISMQATDALTLSATTQVRQDRGVFVLPSTVYFRGDSFWEQPNSHTSSGNSMAFKAAALLGVTGNIDATSGNTSVDKQASIFALSPAVTDIICNDLGQNDAQFVGTGADIERRLNDIAIIQLANIFHMGVPTGSRIIRASAMATAGSWANDTDIAEGGALVSATNGSVLQAQPADCRYVIVIFKLKAASGGTFSVVIDNTTYLGSFDFINGFHTAPFGNIPSNTGQNYARAALVFDLGRRKPFTNVQMVVTSATAAGNTVSIHSVIGLSGDPLQGPLAVSCDLSDRGATGYATAAGSQASVPIVSRIINQALAAAGACGCRVVPVSIGAVINPNTDLDTDQFHPSEIGANNGAAAIANAINNAARDWSVIRPDLDAQSLVNGASGYVLLSQQPLLLDADGLWKRKKLSPRAIGFRANDPILCPDSIRVCFDDGSGAFTASDALYLARDTGTAGLAYSGNLGATGDYMLVARGTSRIRLSDVELFPVTDNVINLGDSTHRFSSAWFSGVVITTPTTVAGLPAAATGLQGARSFVGDATQALTAGIGAVVAGGGANRVPVICDGTNWRIG